MISIIVPVYEAELTIVDTVESVISQSYTNWELILVVDGSPDNSGKICDQITQQYNDNHNFRIRVIHQQNQGLSGARNVGILHAKGEYVCFIDSDDTVESDYLSSLIMLYDEYDTDLAICGMKFINGVNENTNSFACLESFSDLFNNKKFISLFETGLMNSACNKLYKSCIIKNNSLKFQKISIVEDLAFNIDYFRCINTVSVTTSSPYCYRIYNSTLTRNVSEEMFANYIHIHKVLYGLVAKQNHYIIDGFIFHQYFSITLRYLKKIIAGEFTQRDVFPILLKYHCNEHVKNSFANYHTSINVERIMIFLIKHKQYALLCMMLKVLS